MKALPKVYDPGTVEKRIYDMWQSHGCSGPTFGGMLRSFHRPLPL